MRTIKSYLLDKSSIGIQSLYLPSDAKLVSIQDTDIGLTMFAVTDPNNHRTDLRTFKICSADETIYNDNIVYIGSYKSDNGIRHVVETI